MFNDHAMPQIYPQLAHRAIGSTLVNTSHSALIKLMLQKNAHSRQNLVNVNIKTNCHTVIFMTTWSIKRNTCEVIKIAYQVKLVVQQFPVVPFQDYSLLWPTQLDQTQVASLQWNPHSQFYYYHLKRNDKQNNLLYYSFTVQITYHCTLWKTVYRN